MNPRPDGPGDPDDHTDPDDESGAADSGAAHSGAAGGGGSEAGVPGIPGIPGFPGMSGFPGMPGMGDGADLGAMFAQLGRMLSWKGTGVNWDLARDVARQTVSAGGDRSVSRPEQEAALAAVRLAEIWLDTATALPASGMEGIAWSRAEWVEGTLRGWQTLVDPVAERVVEALGAQLPAQLGELAPGLGAGAGAGPMAAMLRQLGGALFGTQIGQAIGALAGEVVATGEVGIPVADPPRLALLPANVAAFGEGLELPADDVRLYLALREAAVQRLYTHVPWLRAHVVGLVEGFGRGVVIDTDKLRDAASRLDPSDPQALQDALGSGLFEPERTPAQDAALAQLETVLALVEGWIDEVVSLAAADRLPSAIGLAETIRRRRALGGPAEQTFGALVGLDLRPRRMREAAQLWGRLRAERGVDGRDAIWAHPDLLPSPADLDDPQTWDGGLAGLTLTDADFDALTRTDDDPPEPSPGESA
jgi:putative hydrolase